MHKVFSSKQEEWWVRRTTLYYHMSMDFPGGSEVTASACNVGDLDLIPGLGRSPGEGNGNPLQHSCLENPMDGEAWWATVHRVTKSRTQLSDFTFHFHVTCPGRSIIALHMWSKRERKNGNKWEGGKFLNNG